jgi:hypothetical protein
LAPPSIAFCGVVHPLFFAYLAPFLVALPSLAPIPKKLYTTVPSANSNPINKGFLEFLSPAPASTTALAIRK